MATVLAFGTTAHAQSWLATPGAPGSAAVTVGHATLRLPPGHWLMVSASDDVPLQSGGRSLRIETRNLAQVEAGRVVSIVTVSSNATRSGGGWAADRQCARRDVLFVQNASEWDKTYDCMMVNHQMFALGTNPSPSWIETQQKLSGLGALAQPYIFADFAKSSGSRLDFVKVNVCFNPALAGFPDDASASWNGSAWNRLRITADRQAYVGRIVAWARAYHATVAGSF